MIRNTNKILVILLFSIFLIFGCVEDGSKTSTKSTICENLYEQIHPNTLGGLEFYAEQIHSLSGHTAYQYNYGYYDYEEGRTVGRRILLFAREFRSTNEAENWFRLANFNSTEKLGGYTIYVDKTSPVLEIAWFYTDKRTIDMKIQISDMNEAKQSAEQAISELGCVP